MDKSLRIYKLMLLVAWSLTAVSNLLAATEAEEAELNGYELIWSDEFENDGVPDPNRWIFEQGFVRNRELQWYQEENARCRDGFLIIEARRERVTNPDYNPNKKDWKSKRRAAAYTSSCVKTAGKFSWQYGILEVRARMDAETGKWPAIWTLGNSRNWPACGEVDLFEYYDDKILANACWQDPSKGRRPIWDGSKTPLKEFGGQQWAEQFHTWTMVWNEDSIVLKLDGKVLNTIDIREVPDLPGRPHPFRQPHYVLLNLAIGGTNGGDPFESKFPSQFMVDYVRVYQKPAGEEEQAR